MNSENLLHTTIMIRFFISILLVLFLFTVKSKNKIGNFILGFFLILGVIDTSTIFYRDYIELYPRIDILRMDVGSFFYAPLLYLFVFSVIHKNFKIKLKHLLHIIPFIIGTLVMLPRFYLADYIERMFIYNNYTQVFEGKFSYILGTIQMFGYIIATFILLCIYKKKLLQNYSVFYRTNYRWLFQMNVIVLIIFIIVIIKNLYRFGDNYGYITLLRFFVEFTTLVFNCWLILKAMYAPKIFRGIDSNLKLVSALVKNDSRNLNQEKDKAEYFSKQRVLIETFMKEKEPFLNSDLTIKDLAQQLDIDVRDLSILINSHLNKNFYEFISDYRIEKAKEILKDVQFNHLTILEILYSVGFNSKSSFNTSFKKTTGLTPTEFRKQNS